MAKERISMDSIKEGANYTTTTSSVASTAKKSTKKKRTIRDLTVSTRLSKDEKNIIEELALKDDISISAYLGKVVINHLKELGISTK